MAPRKQRRMKESTVRMANSLAFLLRIPLPFLSRTTSILLNVYSGAHSLG